MKQFILLTLMFMLFGCEEPKQVYEMSIQTYVISHKQDAVQGRHGYPPKLYFQTPRSTEYCWVDSYTYDKYQVGDTIQVLIKYWEKPKKK
jgi:hypothetical protein